MQKRDGVILYLTVGQQGRGEAGRTQGNNSDAFGRKEILFALPLGNFIALSTCNYGRLELQVSVSLKSAKKSSPPADTKL